LSLTQEPTEPRVLGAQTRVLPPYAPVKIYTRKLRKCNSRQDHMYQQYQWI